MIELFDQETLGVELITNGNFADWTDDDPDDWTVTGESVPTRGVTEVNGNCRMYSTDGSLIGMSQVALEVGKVYKISVDILVAVVGKIKFITINGSFILEFDTVGTGQYGYLIAESDKVFIYRSGNPVDLTFDNVSIREVLTPDKRITPPDVWPQVAGAEAIDLLNNRDFNTDEGDWVVEADGTGTLVHDTNALGFTGRSGPDDAQLKIESNPAAGGADTFLYASLPTASISGLTVNTLFRVEVLIACPTGNSTKVVKIRANSISGDAGSPEIATLDAFDAWQKVVMHNYFLTDLIGTIEVGFSANPGDNDIIYIDNVSIRPVELSWVPRSTNKIAVDETEDALKITYVDNTNGMQLNLRDSADLSADLIIGQNYILTYDVKGNADSANDVRLYITSAGVYGPVFTETWATYTITFVATSTNNELIRITGMDQNDEVWIRNLSLVKANQSGPGDQINDAMNTVLVGEVTPGHLNDMLAEWLIANGATGGALPDLWDQFFEVRDVGVPGLGNELFDMEALGAEGIIASDDRDFTVFENVNWEDYSGGVISDGSGKAIVTMDASALCGITLLTAYSTNHTRGKIYKFSADVWTGTSTSKDLKFWANNSTITKTFTASSARTTYTLYFSAGVSSSGIRITFTDSDNGTFFVDNVSVKEVVSADRRITPPDVWPQLAGLELVTDGDCSSDSFDKAAGWTYDAVNNEYDASSPNYGTISQAVGTVVGQLYRVQFTLRNYVSGRFKAQFSTSGDGQYYEADGTYVDYIIAGSETVKIQAFNTAVGSVTDISCREVALSWVPYGTNTLGIDSDALNVVAVDDGQGAYLQFRDANDLSADLVVGETYLVTFEAKALGTVTANINGVLDQTGNINTSAFQEYSLSFTATHVTDDHIKFAAMGAGEEVWIRNISIKQLIWTGDRNDRAYEWLESIGMGSNPELITLQNDRDFSSENIGNWTVGKDGTGSCTYDGTNPGAEKVGKLLSSGDTYLYGVLATTEMSLKANTLYKISASMYVPAGNTSKRVTFIPSSTLIGATFVNNYLTLSDDVWTEVVNYVQVADDIDGSFAIGFYANPADGDIVYFDNVSVKNANAGHINDMWLKFWTSGGVAPAYLSMQEVATFLVGEGWGASIVFMALTRGIQVTIGSNVHRVDKAHLIARDYGSLPGALRHDIDDALALQGF